MSRSSQNNYVICFFCLRRVPYSQVKVVTYKIPHIDFDFRVYACQECIQKLKDKVSKRIYISNDIA